MKIFMQWIAILGLAFFCCSGPVGAGAKGGPKVANSVVLPNNTDVYKVKFTGKEVAIVTIKGDGSTDLDFYVYDSNDNLVTKDDDSTDHCRLVWVPKSQI